MTQTLWISRCSCSVIVSTPSSSFSRHSSRLAWMSQLSPAMCSLLTPGVHIPGRRQAWMGAWASAKQHALAILSNEKYTEQNAYRNAPNSDSMGNVNTSVHKLIAKLQAEAQAHALHPWPAPWPRGQG